ncbi:MAG: peptidoglycan-binding protein [Alphaproteobacteria bacterium]|nr:peptidoglycan-binding protein [Alphaproteobacteria bacterium]
MPRLLAATLVLAIAAPAMAQVAAPSFVQPLAPSALRAVQERLHAAGFYNGTADGAWNEDSQAALQRFQENRQLQPTGQLNGATAAALGLSPQQLLGIGPPEQAQPSPSASSSPQQQPQAPPRPIRLGPAAMRNVQGRLQALGFYHGAVDGLWGPATQEAITAFQRDHDLNVTGRLDPATVSAMGLDPYDPSRPM